MRIHILGNTKMNCSPAIPLIQTVHLIQPLQPLTAHQTAKIQLYPLNYFSIHVKTSSHFQKNFKFLSLSLSPPKSLFLNSHPSTTLVRWQIAPTLRWRTALTSSESSKLSGTLSFSLYPSLPHSSLTLHLSSHRFCRAIFARRHSCASISTALPDFSLPRNHQPPPWQPPSNILT